MVKTHLYSNRLSPPPKPFEYAMLSMNSANLRKLRDEGDQVKRFRLYTKAHAYKKQVAIITHSQLVSTCATSSAYGWSLHSHRRVLANHTLASGEPFKCHMNRSKKNCPNRFVIVLHNKLCSKISSFITLFFYFKDSSTLQALALSSLECCCKTNTQTTQT